MDKLNYVPRTLDNVLIKDALCAVSTLEDSPQSKGLYFVVGGIAAQSYLPSACRRATSDVDLAILKPLNHEDFKSFSAPAAQFLRDNGYEVETKKGHNSHYLIFHKGNEANVVGFARRNESNFSNARPRLEREIRNSRKKIVEGRTATYPVSSPEDIVVPKLVRCVGSLERNPCFSDYIESQTYIPMDEKQIHTALKNLAELREEASFHIADTSIAEKLRFISDMFDTRVLSVMVGFNELYFLEAMQSWETLSKNSNEKNVLFKNVLPQIDFGKPICIE
jgi:hypothetical protein